MNCSSSWTSCRWSEPGWPGCWAACLGTESRCKLQAAANHLMGPTLQIDVPPRTTSFSPTDHRDSSLVPALPPSSLRTPLLSSHLSIKYSFVAVALEAVKSTICLFYSHRISEFPGSAFLLFHMAHSGSLSFTHKSCLLSKGSNSVLDSFRTETLWRYRLMVCSLGKLRHFWFHWTIPDTPCGYPAAARAVVILQLWFCRAGSSAAPSAHRWSRC